MPCVSVCVMFSVQVKSPYHYKYLYIGLAHLDNSVLCNKRHPEDGLMGPKHVDA